MQKRHNDNMQIRSKLWIEVSGEAVFGRGRVMLLKAIDKYGSINQAAKEINISYRKAWEYIKAMEQRLSMQLVHRKSGGINGGGAAITEDAKKFISLYNKMDSCVQKYVDEKFASIFKAKKNKHKT